VTPLSSLHNVGHGLAGTASLMGLGTHSGLHMSFVLGVQRVTSQIA
jgi:hypothetical protein